MKFRCLRSGHIAEFSNPNDIEQMKTHPAYEEVKDETDEKDEKAQQKAQKRRVLKLRNEDGTV